MQKHLIPQIQSFSFQILAQNILASSLQVHLIFFYLNETGTYSKGVSLAENQCFR